MSRLWNEPTGLQLPSPPEGLHPKRHQHPRTMEPREDGGGRESEPRGRPPALRQPGVPRYVSVLHAEGRILQYAINLTKKRKRFDQPGREERSLQRRPIAIARKHPQSRSLKQNH